MTSSAPRSVRPRARSGLAETAVTWAPPMWASWTAKRPTPPLAPVTSTRRAIGLPPMSRASRAVIPATGSAAAWAKLTSSGRTAMACVGTAASCAHALSWSATTRAPSGGPLPSAAGAAHRPGEVPAGEAARRLVGQPLDLAAVERDGLDGDEGLVGQRLGVGRLGQLDARICGGSQQGEHGPDPTDRGSPARGARIGVMDPHAHPGPVAVCLRRAPARVRGRVAVAAGGALVAGAARAARGGLRAAHAAAARPRPDRALQGLPPPQAQDAGLRGARGRSLPHAPDPHARGHPDLAHRRARPAAQRGPDRGHRAGPRPRPSGLRAHRRGRARRLPAPALRHAAFATTSTRCASSTSSSSTAPG